MTFSFSTVAQCNRIHFPLFLKPFLSFSLLDATWQAASFFDICLSLSHVQRLPVAVPRWLVCKTRKEMTCVCFFFNNRHHTLYVSLPHVVLVKFNTGIKKKKRTFLFFYGVLLWCSSLSQRRASVSLLYWLKTVISLQSIPDPSFTPSVPLSSPLSTSPDFSVCAPSTQPSQFYLHRLPSISCECKKRLIYYSTCDALQQGRLR